MTSSSGEVFKSCLKTRLFRAVCRWLEGLRRRLAVVISGVGIAQPHFYQLWWRDYVVGGVRAVKQAQTPEIHRTVRTRARVCGFGSIGLLRKIDTTLVLCCPV